LIKTIKKAAKRADSTYANPADSYRALPVADCQVFVTLMSWSDSLGRPDYLLSEEREEG